jgi:hypothetical protein
MPQEQASWGDAVIPLVEDRERYPCGMATETRHDKFPTMEVIGFISAVLGTGWIA